jgi:hypothetical protein
VAGIDPHKRTFTVAVLDERGGLHGVARFDTSEQGLAVVNRPGFGRDSGGWFQAAVVASG